MDSFACGFETRDFVPQTVSPRRRISSHGMTQTARCFAYVFSMPASLCVKIITPGLIPPEETSRFSEAAIHAEQQRLSRKGLPHRDAQTATAQAGCRRSGRGGGRDNLCATASDHAPKRLRRLMKAVPPGPHKFQFTLPLLSPPASSP